MSHRDNDAGGDDAPQALPIAADDCTRLLDGLKDFKSVVLAVSGGADSMGLMVLAAQWLSQGAAGRSPHIEVVTVDHGLRPGSAEEARFVHDQASALGFAHTTLTWTGPKPSFGIEDAARRARYELLAEYARSKPPPRAVVTAHTQDDQAETLLMRLARGSGVDGLAAMPARRPLTEDRDVMLLRPLLGVSKARLVATLKQAGKTWVEDPSNELETFERVRLRRARAAFAAAGLTAGKLALSAARLGRAREALDATTASFLATHVALNGGAFASIDRRVFSRAPREMRVRALAGMLRAFGGNAPAARLAQVEALEALIEEAGEARRTLGGCLVSVGRKTIRVFREPEGRDLPHMEIRPGTVVIWDRRFEIRVAEDARTLHLLQPLAIRAIGMEAYATLKSQLKCRLPSRPAASLPALWSKDKIVGVPDLIWPHTQPSHAGEPSEGVDLVRFGAKFISEWPASSPEDAAPSRG